MNPYPQDGPFGAIGKMEIIFMNSLGAEIGYGSYCWNTYILCLFFTCYIRYGGMLNTVFYFYFKFNKFSNKVKMLIK